MFSKLQYISQGLTAKAQIENIREALDAGCKWIQLRFKNSDEKEFYSVAAKVKEICSTYQTIFIINDNVELAKKIDSDGVHLGLQDMPVVEARQILGPDKIIGGSANTLKDVLVRIDEKCDYIGLGPYRFTKTKEKLSPVLSLESYKFILDQILNINIPVYAIGGICAEDVDAILQTGIYGIAVSGAITNSTNKKTLIQEFNRILYDTVENSR